MTRLLLGFALLAGCSAARPQADALPSPFEPVVAGQFEDARALATDGRGRLYVADAGARHIAVLTTGGSLIQTISGSADTPLSAPVDVTAFGGLTISVADAGLAAVARFGIDGRALGLLRPDGRNRTAGIDETRPIEARDRFTPAAIASAPDGTLYAASDEGAVVQITPDFRQTVLRRADTADALIGVTALAATDDAVFSVQSGRLVRLDRLLVRGQVDPDVAEVQAISAQGDRLLIVTSTRALVSLPGEASVEIAFPARIDVRGAVLIDRTLFVLTRTGLWRLAV